MNDKVLVNSSKRITQGFKNTHLAIDLGSKPNEEENIVKAHSAGIIEELVDGKDRNRGSSGIESYGNYILINHENGFKTRYAHLQKYSILVKKGERICANIPLGVMGESGNAYGRHLHFEVIKDNKRINPTIYLTKNFFENKKELTYQAYDFVKKKWLSNIIVGAGFGILSYAGNFGNSISGLYIDHLTYRVHDKIKNIWLPFVVGRSDYAGNLENPIDGVQIYGAIYRVHLKNGNWLSWVSKVDNTSDGYAGIYGREIDAIQIKF